MKKLLIILTLLLLPVSAHAFTATWNATSSTGSFITPDIRNGVQQGVQANSFIATSTTATSTFAGDLTAANIYATVLVNYGTAASLAAEVPLTSERVYETDTTCTKIGNGSSAVSALPCLSASGGGAGTGWASSTSPSDIHFTGNGGVGIGTLTPRGMFDINTLQSIGNVTGESIVQNTTGTNNFDDTNGYYFSFYVYAYRTISGTRIYSATPTLLEWSEAGDIGGPYHFVLSWSAVSGADGYSVVVNNDDYDGFYGDWYKDVAGTTINYGDGTESTFINATPDTSQTSLGASLYVSSTTGRLISEKGADFSSDLTATGATLSGTLSGTTAVFSGNVAASSFSGSGASLTGVFKTGSGNKGIGTQLFDILNDSGLSSGFAQGITIGGSGTHLYFYNTAASANSRLWDYIVGPSSWQVRLVNDANSAANTAFQINRSGIIPTSIIFPYAAPVGIGTTTPFATALSIKGAGSSTGKNTVISDSNNRIIFSFLDNGKMKVGSTTPATNLFDVDGVISSGADGNIGGGELRSYQTPSFYVSLTTDTVNNKSGILRSNGTGDKFFVNYNTSSGDTQLSAIGGASTNIMFNDGAIEAGRMRNGMWSLGMAKFPAHTLDITQPAISTAKTASYDAIKSTNTATSSTASVIMAGLESVVTGTNSGVGAQNVGLYVSSVSGGTSNYDAIFNGTGKVAIGTTTTAGEDVAIYDGTGLATMSLAGLTGGEFKIAQGGNVANGYMGISYVNPKLGLTRSGTHLLWYNTSTGDVVFNNTFGGTSKLQLKYGDVEGLALDSGLDIGIGSTSPYARLSVSSATQRSGNLPLFQVASTTNTNLFQVTDNGTATFGGPAQLKGYTVTTLPTCAAGSQGYVAFVTDATTPTYLGTAVGGGAVVAPVFCNGTNWVTQ